MIQTRTVPYVIDGAPYEGLIAWDDGNDGPRPGVLVSHAWGGSGPFERGRAEALAGLGYAGFCLDVYGAGRRGTNPEENAALMGPLKSDRPQLQHRLLAALAAMKAQPEVDAARTAAIGFCFGGLCVLDLARVGAEVLGVASFHGLFEPPGNTAGNRIEAKVLALHGWDDPMVPPAQAVALAQELTAAGADWQLHGYGHTMHGFSNPAANAPESGILFSERAERRSWKALTDFLAELF